MKNLLRILIVLELLLGTTSVFANPFDFSILGVITSSRGKKGVALMKQKSSDKVSAFKEGDEVVPGTKIKSILRKTVTFSYQNKLYELTVGEDKPRQVNEASSGASVVASNLTHAAGIEKDGDVLKVSRSLKDSLSSSEGLNKILMQAAAISYVQNGKLVGFRLLEIDAGSIFEMAGFQNGDIITHINEQPLNDAGLAIRALGSLKTAASASFGYLRGTTAMSLTIQIH